VEQGKIYLLKLLDLQPNNATTLYNLACADSLLGNISESLLVLERSIDAGYRGLEHIFNDKDLDNIRDTEEFKFLIQKLENILFDGGVIETSQNNINKSEKKWKKELEVLINLGCEESEDVLCELLEQCEGKIENVISLLF